MTHLERLTQIAARLDAAARSLARDPAVRVAAAAAFVTCALYSWPAFWAVEHRLGRDRIANALLATFAIYLLATFSRAAFAVATTVSLALAALAAWFSWHYRIRLGPDVWNVLRETNAEEASGFVSGGLVAWVLCAVAIAGVLSYLAAARGRGPAAPRIVLAVVLALTVSRAAWVHNDASYGMPYMIGRSYVQYLLERRAFAQLVRDRRDISQGAFAPGDDDLTVVFVVGESARRDHFHANGYPRPTSPRLEERGAAAYSAAVSCAGLTRRAVPCMFGRASGIKDDPTAPETTFISVLKKLGYATTWISNQGRLGKHETPVTVIAGEAAREVHVNRTGNFDTLSIHDEELLPPLDEALRGPRQGRLVVLHMIGSHWNYDAHYPAAFAAFTPPCASASVIGCPRDRLINSYDNTIAYTDHVLGEVIRRVAGRHALVFYASDHGESLGEGDVFAHWDIGSNPALRSVGMFVWASPEFMHRHPERAAAIVANKDRPVVHHNLFHSVLDCAGITSPIIDTTRSICRPGVLRD